MRIFSKEMFLFFTGCGLLLLFFVGLWYFFFHTKTPRPQPGNFNANYSNFNNLVPGKNTKKDIVAMNGPYESEKTVGNKDYLYYATPSDTIKNVAVLENNILLYATEEVFAKYRGSPEDYIKKLGKPEVVMYDKDDIAIRWDVYPSRGIAFVVTPFENVIVKIAYFIPQTKDSFFENLATELGITENKNEIPTEHIESI